MKKSDKSVSCHCFEQSIINNDNVEVINLNKQKQTIHCKLTTSKLSKLLMYDFNYNVIRKQYRERAKLLFTDTDSLCYAIETEDIYNDLYNNRALCDFSDCLDDHEYYINNNLKNDRAKVKSNWKIHR